MWARSCSRWCTADRAIGALLKKTTERESRAWRYYFHNEICVTVWHCCQESPNSIYALPENQDANPTTAATRAGRGRVRVRRARDSMGVAGASRARAPAVDRNRPDSDKRADCSARRGAAGKNGVSQFGVAWRRRQFGRIAFRPCARPGGGGTLRRFQCRRGAQCAGRTLAHGARVVSHRRQDLLDQETGPPRAGRDLADRWRTPGARALRQPHRR